MTKRRAVVTGAMALGLALGCAAPGSAAGVPIAGGSRLTLTAIGGPVYARFLSSAMPLLSEVWFFAIRDPGPIQRPSATGAQFLFANTGRKFSEYGHAPAGAFGSGLSATNVFLGNVAAGTPLFFALYVPGLHDVALPPTGRWWYSGQAARNPDGNVHAQLTELNRTTTQVGFEALCKGAFAPGCAGDNVKAGAGWTYDAEVFNVQGATVTPEPLSLVLFGTGLTGLGALRRRRRKPAQDARA